MIGLPRTIAICLVVALALTCAACFGINRQLHLGVTDGDARQTLVASTIVYVKGGALYRARGDGSAPSRLIGAGSLGEGGALFSPAVTPDGRHVLFLAVEDLNVRDRTGRNLSLNLLTMTGDVITQWRKVLFARLVPPGADGRQDILAAGAAAAWSSDASRIALGVSRAAGTSGCAAVIFDNEGHALSTHEISANLSVRIESLSWIGPGAGIILGLTSTSPGDASEPGRVVRLDWTSSEGQAGPARAIDLAAGSYPTLSPDGTRIAVVDERDGVTDLVLLSLKGEEQDRFSKPAGKAINHPFWSPDGRYIYYYSLASTGPLGLIEISMLRCLDTRTRQVFDLVRLG